MATQNANVLSRNIKSTLAFPKNRKCKIGLSRNKSTLAHVSKSDYEFKPIVTREIFVVSLCHTVPTSHPTYGINPSSAAE